jgi:hypothetical protein
MRETVRQRKSVASLRIVKMTEVETEITMGMLGLLREVVG